MAAGDTDLGNGLILVVPGTFAAPILGIDHSGAERAMVNVATIVTGTRAAAAGAPFIAGTVYDPGELVVHCHYKTNEIPPIQEPVGAVTITYVDTVVFTCQGAVSGFSIGMPMEDVMTIDVTIKLSGSITIGP